jgi:hypothetical protein
MGFEGGPEQRRDGRALAQGNGRHAASLVTAAIGQVADPLELIRRAPAPGELIRDPPGERRQQLDERPERLHRIVERRRLLEDRRRRPGASGRGSSPRASCCKRGPSPPRRSKSAAGGRAASSPRVRMPQRSSRAAISGRRIEERHRSRAPDTPHRLGLDDGDALVQAAGEARADPAAAMPTRIPCPRSPPPPRDAGRAAPRFQRAHGARWRRDTRDRRRLPPPVASGRARPRAARARPMAPPSTHGRGDRRCAS